jgi:hypothetical protein
VPTRLDPGGPQPHYVSFAFEGCIVVEGNPTLPRRSFHTSLFLLHDVPAFMRKMVLLTGAEEDIFASRVRQRIELSRPRGVVVNSDIREIHSGEHFEAFL